MLYNKWPFMKKKMLFFTLCFEFVSFFFFVDNQHLGMKIYFRMKEGPKDKVILRITLISQKMF
jgi:hypothetical protein